jgi:ATP-dependent Clp protease ATP-binding subunit ClpC
VSPAQTSIPLSFGADQLIASALRKQQESGGAKLGVNHWLAAVLEHQAKPARDLFKGVDTDALAASLTERLAEGDPGDALSREAAIGPAAKRARGQDHSVVETEDLATAVVAAAGNLSDLLAAQPETGKRPSPPVEYTPRSTQPTPTLEEYGRDLTAEAKEGKLPPIIGREAETELVIETICRHSKRNPALVGPAGTGKTAIVEGLAQRIVAGDVPEPLHGVRIVAIQASNLTSGASVVGELEKRMKAVIEEASQDGIVLFIDELHSIVGSGGRQGVGDVGALLKPHIARGDMAVIGATTDDEFRQYIEPDKALERRFNRVRVQEMAPKAARTVISAHRDMLQELRGVEVPEAVLDWLMDFAGQYLKNRFFPDKAVDLLEQCVAHAVVEGEDKVTLAGANQVAERMVGMPVGLTERLDALQRALIEDGLMSPEDADELTDRLSVTAQGLDVRPERPNGVLLLTGKAAGVTDAIAQTVAARLFGSPKRIVDIDFAQFTEDEDLNSLIGSPPGYIGFGGRRPLHELAQMPWSVLLCRNVDVCHPEVARVLGQGLADGVITERSGRRIYLSDTVAVLTAATGAAAKAPIGFGLPQDEDGDEGSRRTEEAVRAGAEKALGADFVSQIDLVCDRLPEAGSGQRALVERSLLGGLADRYGHRGLSVEWDDSLIEWVLAERERHRRWGDLTRLVEDSIGEALIPLLPKPGGRRKRVRVKASDGKPEAEAVRSRKGRAKRAR